MSERAIPDSRRRRIRRRLRRNPGLTVINDDSVRPVTHSKQTIWGSLDKPLLGVVILLLTIGSIMVFSSTFDWSRTTHGTGYGFFVEQHLRNVGFAVILMTFFAVVDYRFWKRFAILLLLFTLVSLVAVLAVGEPVFGARRSFIGGRFQPGELAELTIVIYMAAWLSAKKTRVDSIFHGLLPFLAVVGVVAALIVAQPDLSSAAIVVLTASVMFFVAGANLFHLGALAGVTGVAGLVVINIWSFSQTRIANFLAGLSDITSSDYHTQQAIVAFLHGGWFGVGLGQSQQKFGALPAPHTDSIFAIIGEELGVFGAAIVVTLYIFFAIRGFQMGRLARDNFGSLLCVGVTAWVIIRALLNIAVMTGRIPSTGVPLPFISFGGSSLTVVMVGVGLMISVHRVATRRRPISERRGDIAYFDRSWRNRRARLSRSGNRPSPAARG